MSTRTRVKLTPDEVRTGHRHSMKPTPHQQLVSKCLGKFLVSPFGDGRSFECYEVGGEVLYCRGWGHAIGHDIRLDPARLAEFQAKGWTWQDTKPEVDPNA